MIRRSLISLSLFAIVSLAASGCAQSSVALESNRRQVQNGKAFATLRNGHLEVDAYALPPPEALAATTYVVWGGERGDPPRNLGSIQFRTSEEARSGAGVLRTEVAAMPPVLFITAERSASASSPTLPPLLWR